MDIIKKLGLLLLLILGSGVVAAQDATASTGVTLIPYTDETFSISGVRPEGWIKSTPGIYARNSATGDVTLIAQQAAAAELDVLVASLLPQLGLTELPESEGTVETDTFTWTLYQVDVPVREITVAVDLALTSADGTAYLILMQTSPEEYEALHESVFLPAVDALRPATPNRDDLPYIAEDVTFDNGDITLAGTLTLPEGDGSHPAVVLISGSGPQDRDESLLPMAEIKPFRLIADYLTRQGIAVLRYDDRGTGKSTGDFVSATSDDFATDASAAIDYLLSRDEIDPAQIGVLGHSEGGLIAAILGARNPNIAFIVSMAGTGVNGRDLLLLQNEKLILAEGGTQEQVQQQIKFLQQAFEIIESGDTETLPALIHDTVIHQLEALPVDQREAIGDIEAYANQVTTQQIDFLDNDWMRFFLAYDPAPDWGKITIPVLALFGGKDVQVDAEQNATPIESALEQAGNTDFQIVTFPTANHLFQDATTGAVSEYATLAQEFVADFLPTISDWILEHVTLPA